MKNSRTKKLVRKCNHILLNNFKKCGCVNKKGYPTNNISKCYNHSKKKRGCKDFSLCLKVMKKLSSGDEPTLEPEPWLRRMILDSHNCYSYFLNDQNMITQNRCRKLCKKHGTCSKKTSQCSSLKPQPSYWAVLRGTRKKRNKKYNCKSMIKSIMDDNKNIKLSSFYKRCPKKYYKGVVVVDSKNPTYHFLRQDNNLFWSHKPGTTPVTNKDASGRLIAVPHLSDMNYSKKSGTLNYDKTCSYMCVPKNDYVSTYSI